MATCIQCKGYFDPKETKTLKLCSDECRAARAHARNKATHAKKRAATAAVMAQRKPIPCRICMKMFVPKKEAQVTCGDRRCVGKNSRDKAKAASNLIKIPDQTMAKYWSRYVPPMDTDSLAYTKLIARLTRKYSGGGISQKMARVIAIQKCDPYMNDIMRLERDYIRAVEKKRLKENIKAVLGTFNAEGSYSLDEVGQVLGITRERARQIEASALKLLMHPSTGKKLKDYL